MTRKLTRAEHFRELRAGKDDVPKFLERRWDIVKTLNQVASVIHAGPQSLPVGTAAAYSMNRDGSMAEWKPTETYRKIFTDDEFKDAQTNFASIYRGRMALESAIEAKYVSSTWYLHYPELAVYGRIGSGWLNLDQKKPEDPERYTLTVHYCPWFNTVNGGESKIGDRALANIAEALTDVSVRATDILDGARQTRRFGSLTLRKEWVDLLRKVESMEPGYLANVEREACKMTPSNLEARVRDAFDALRAPDSDETKAQFGGELVRRVLFSWGDSEDKDLRRVALPVRVVTDAENRYHWSLKGSFVFFRQGGKCYHMAKDPLTAAEVVGDWRFRVMDLKDVDLSQVKELSNSQVDECDVTASWMESLIAQAEKLNIKDRPEGVPIRLTPEGIDMAPAVMGFDMNRHSIYWPEGEMLPRLSQGANITTIAFVKD